MDQKTFLEYWATPEKYVSQPEVPLLSHNQAPTIADRYPYGISCRQIAYTVLVSWPAANVCEFKTFEKMIVLVQDQEITDKNIWNGSEKSEWGGLYKLTLDTCLEVLTAPDLMKVAPSIVQASPASPRPEPWWEQLANDWRENALPIYQIAVLILFFDLSKDEIAARLQIPQEDIGRLQSEAARGILAASRRWSESEFERIQNSIDNVNRRVNRDLLPQEDLPQEDLI